MDNQPGKRGRPLKQTEIRTVRVSGYVTETDADYIREVAEVCGFKSVSEMITAILERLCIGGFAGLVFVKLGLQFSNLLSKKKAQKGFYFGVRPLPPLIGDEPEPTPENLVPFVRDIQNDIRKEKNA